MSKYDDYELVKFSSVRLPYKYDALEPYTIINIIWGI